MTTTDKPPTGPPPEPEPQAEPLTPAARRRLGSTQPVGELLHRLLRKRYGDQPLPAPEELPHQVLEVAGVDPNCPTCKGGGHTRQDLPVGHPQFGQATPCPKCFGPALARARTDRLDAAIPANLRGKTLDTYPGSRAGLAGCQHFLAQADKPLEEVELPWLFLHGPRGTGKTCLGCAVAVQLAERGRAETVVFDTVPLILERIKATYGDDATENTAVVLQTLRTADLVIFDDLGSQRSTPYATETLYSIVDDRYRNRRRTIITSNLSLTKLQERADDNMLRIVDRITELAQVVHVKEPNLRQQAALARELGTDEPGPGAK